MLQAMWGFGAGQPAPYAIGWYLTPELLLALAAGTIGATPIVPRLARRLAAAGDRAFVGPVPSLVGTAALLAILAASVMLSAARTYNPFIYFRF
jgi:hypothetical protein